jgi:hypothetical protein
MMDSPKYIGMDVHKKPTTIRGDEFTRDYTTTECWKPLDSQTSRMRTAKEWMRCAVNHTRLRFRYGRLAFTRVR